MNQESAIVCSTYSEITGLIPFITKCYNTGIYVHFLNINHKNLNCYAIEKTKIIYIPSALKQAATIVMNEYNNHFCINENDDDDHHNNENEQNEENYIDSNIAFTCPACNILTL